LSVKVPLASATSPPFDQRNGKYSCQFFVPSPMPYFDPPFSFIALAAALSSSQVAGGAVMPAFSAISVR
jgi:hypothetical protein